MTDRDVTASAPALTRLVGDAGDFADRVWGRDPLLRRVRDDGTVEALDAGVVGDPGSDDGGRGDGFADLFSLDDVDELVSQRGLRSPFLRLVKNGRAIPSREWVGDGGVGAGVADQALDDGIYAQMAEGATLVLQGLHRMWPSLQAFGRQLSLDLGHPVQVNAYITPAQAQGFGAHYDVHDVFVLQLAGRKRWFVHDPVFELPLASQPGDRYADAIARKAQEEPRLDAVLEPGDCLYLPRGYLHSGQALGEVSAHLTIGVPVWTRHELLVRALERVRASAAEDVELRRALPIGSDPADAGDLAGHVDVVRDALRRAVDELGTDELAEEMIGVAARSDRPGPVRPLRQIRAVRDLAAGDRFVLRQALRPRLDRRDDGAYVLLGRFPSVVFPPSERDDLDVVLAGEPVTVPGDANDPRHRLLRRLAEAGIVVPA